MSSGNCSNLCYHLRFLRGRKRTVDLREIVNAILYLLRTGCAWRYLPHEFPEWTTVYYYLRLLARLRLVRQTQRRITQPASAGLTDATVDPSAAIIDSQSVKTTEHGRRKRL